MFHVKLLVGEGGGRIFSAVYERWLYSKTFLAQCFSPIPVLGCEQQHYMGRGYNLNYYSCMINVTHLIIQNLLQRQTHIHVLNETDNSLTYYYNYPVTSGV